MRSMAEKRNASPQWVKLATFDGDSAVGSSKLTPTTIRRRCYAIAEWLRQAAENGHRAADGGGEEKQIAHDPVVEATGEVVAHDPPDEHGDGQARYQAGVLHPRDAPHREADH